MADHNIRVVSLLNGDEFLSLRSMADEDGLSDSAFMRRLLKVESNRRALEKVSRESRTGEMTEVVQVVHK